MSRPTAGQLFVRSMRAYGRVWYGYPALSGIALYVLFRTMVEFRSLLLSIGPSFSIPFVFAVHQAALAVLVTWWSKTPRRAPTSWIGMLGVTVVMTVTVGVVFALVLRTLRNEPAYWWFLAVPAWPVLFFPAWVVANCEGLRPWAAVTRAFRMMRGWRVSALAVTTLITATSHAIATGLEFAARSFEFRVTWERPFVEAAMTTSMLAVAAEVVYRAHHDSPDVRDVAAVFD